MAMGRDGGGGSGLLAEAEMAVACRGEGGHGRSQKLDDLRDEVLRL